MSGVSESCKVSINGVVDVRVQLNTATTDNLTPGFKQPDAVYVIHQEVITCDDDDATTARSTSSNKQCCKQCCQKNCPGAVECAVCVCSCRLEFLDWYQQADLKGCFQDFFSLQNLKDHFPIMKWVPNYRLKYLQGDAIAGITVGLTVLPQGLAYAKLANLPIQYGLYTSFMCCYVYIFFGTAKDLNMGPTAVMSLLTARFATSPIEGDATYAIVLALMSGIIQFLMAVFHLGFIVEFFSHPVVHSFTMGSVVTIIASQIPNWFGLEDIPREFWQSIYWMCAKLPETRYQDFVLGLICMIVLFLMKHMRDVQCWKPENVAESTTKQAFNYCIWLLSLLRNALVVVAAGGAVAIFELYGYYPFTLPDDVPSGLPPFKPPAFSVSDGNTTYTTSDIFSQIGSGFIVVPLLGLIETVAIGKALGRRNKYAIQPNQELYALGISNILGSFVSAYPVTGSISRSAVNNQSGCMSTGSGFYTGTVVILVTAFLTPLFAYIPDAALAAIIIMAVADMADFHFILELWYTKRLDLLAWVITFIVGLTFGIEVGLIAGCLVSLCFLLYPTARPHLQISESKVEDEHEEQDEIFKILPEYVIVTPHEGLVFPSIEHFKEKMLQLAVSESETGTLYRSLILDFTHVTNVDYSTMQGVQELIDDFAVLQVLVVFCEMRPQVNTQLMKAHLRNFRCTETVSEAVNLIQDDFEQRQMELAAVRNTDINADNDNNHSLHSNTSVCNNVSSSCEERTNHISTGAAANWSKDAHFEGTDNLSFQF